MEKSSSRSDSGSNKSDKMNDKISKKSSKKSAKSDKSGENPKEIKATYSLPEDDKPLDGIDPQINRADSGSMKQTQNDGQSSDSDLDKAVADMVPYYDFKQ